MSLLRFVIRRPDSVASGVAKRPPRACYKPDAFGPQPFYIRTCTSIWVYYIHTYVCIHTHIHTCIHAFMHDMHICIQVHTCMHAYTDSCVTQAYTTIRTPPAAPKHAGLPDSAPVPGFQVLGRVQVRNTILSSPFNRNHLVCKSL